MNIPQISNDSDPASVYRFDMTYALITKSPLSDTVSQPIISSKKKVLPKRVAQQGFMEAVGFDMSHKKMVNYLANRCKDRFLVREKIIMKMGTHQQDMVGQ